MSESKLKLEILCVSMNQNDLSLVDKMNVRSDIIIANQTDCSWFVEKKFAWGCAKMVSTQTRGVGRNRNIAFMYAEGDILLLSDDDMHYTKDYAEKIISEFEKYPDADVIIFNILSNDPRRQQKQNNTTKKLNSFSKLPYGAPRIALRRTAWEKSNVWFTVLFGGGAKYTNGEDSVFLEDLRKKGMNIYVSNNCIGTVDMDNSSWFSGANEEFYFNKGAFCASTHSFSLYFRLAYYVFRLKSDMSFVERAKWLNLGVLSYKAGKSYKEVKDN